MRLLAIFALTVGCSQAPVQPPDSPPDLGEPAPDLAPVLPPGVSPFDDSLSPLATIVGDAPVVGVGESVHTSDGFMLAKAHLVQWLVTQRGFRVLSFEWQRNSGDVVEAYLQTGAGDSTKATRGLSVWANTTVRALLEWLRAWNVMHPDDPVHFFGFDVQQPDADGQTLDAWLAQHAPGLAAGIATCDRGQFLTSMSYAAADFQACLAGLDAIDPQIGPGDDGARIAYVGLRAWQGTIFYESTDLVRSMEARDQAMAWMFDHLRAARFPSAKTIVWAHNEHLSQHHPEIVGAFGEGARSMGTTLAAELGASYVAIGLTGWRIGIDWPNVGCGPLDPLSDPGSVEERLHELARPSLLVDLSGPFFAAGESEEFAFGQTLVPARQFQALVFIDDSPKMTPLDWPSCTP